MDSSPTVIPPTKPRRLWRTILIGLAAVVLLLVVAAVLARDILFHRAEPILRGRVIETLSTRFNAKVELDSLDVSVLRGFEVTGRGLRILPPDDIVALGYTTPMIAVHEFRFHVMWQSLTVKPTHIGTVDVTGLEIHIPPRQIRDQMRELSRTRPAPTQSRGKIEIVVDHFLCEQSSLVIDSNNPTREPRRFALDRIELWNIRGDAPWRYDATLINAIPRGNIHATGTFGPWVTESPGDSTLNGHYSFDHADLNTIRGLGGMLSSVGDFTGQLNHIAVNGTTDTPDFSLDSADYPMPLKTKFQAVVDGTTGDTYLNDVQAVLRNTPIDCKGSVINIRGQGHAIDVTADVPDGRVQDLLAVAVRTRPVYLTGQIVTRAHLHIRPGKERVMEKLAVSGRFSLRQMQFTNAKVQDKVDELSARAQGRPQDAKPGAPATASQIMGDFALDHGRLTFQQLDYTLPGADVQLSGLYSLSGEQFDFHGRVRTDAQLSQMVASRWKSFLLKPVDRFFRKDGAGTEVPIRIEGIHNEPHFGLDFGHKDPPKP